MGAHEVAPAEALHLAGEIAAHAPAEGEQRLRLRCAVQVAEHALEAHDGHVLKVAQEEGADPLEDLVVAVEVEQSQTLDLQAVVAADVLTEDVQGVAGDQEALAPVDGLDQIVPVRAQSAGGPGEAVLGAGAHIDQIDAAVQEGGPVLIVGLHHLGRGAALFQIAHVGQVAVQIAQLRVQQFNFHGARPPLHCVRWPAP